MANSAQMITRITMSEGDDEFDDGDFDENADPNTSHVSQSNTSSTNYNPVKKSAKYQYKYQVPAEFFTWVGDVPGKNASVYRCLHPGCVQKKKKNGSDRTLVVHHNSLINAKRHFLSHDPGNKHGHKELWEDAVKLLRVTKRLSATEEQESIEKMLYSDVTFNINGRKFVAHKNILAKESPVFAAMFRYHTKESLSEKVEVEDVDPDVFQEVIRYLYTGSPQSTAMDVMAPALLAAADKYMLDELKTLCETHLIRKMSAKNCIDLLSLTTNHPAEYLKKYAIEYFRRYPNQVMETDNWKKLKEENLAVLCDLQQKVLTALTI